MIDTMSVLIFDFETSTSNNGHFADLNNKAVSVGFKWLNGDCNTYRVYDKDYSHVIQNLVDRATLLVGFNIKFDLHWLRNIGVKFEHKKIWDCQIAEFLFGCQTSPYPSLNQALEFYGLPLKLDVVKEEYWDKGVDTQDVPPAILDEYLVGDLVATEGVFKKQAELFKTIHKGKYKLFQLQCMDLLVLQEMEYNGIKFESEEARQAAIEIEGQIADIERSLRMDIGGVDGCPINFNSNDHVSAILYGGTISEPVKVPNGVFKTGLRAGQIKYKNETVDHTFPRLVQPLKNTETVKSHKKVAEGGDHCHWSVSEDVLLSLKANKLVKGLVTKLLELSKLNKLKNTYLLGYPDLIDKMNWPKGMLHGNLNQCTAVTGRLSSTKPNMQNIDPITKRYMTSRYI
jgi:DNA polymerase I-like protein with 3'-5' exonuclease and polymerase domains